MLKTELEVVTNLSGFCEQFVDLQDISSKKGIDVNKLEFGMTTFSAFLLIVTYVEFCFINPVLDLLDALSLIHI